MAKYMDTHELELLLDLLSGVGINGNSFGSDLRLAAAKHIIRLSLDNTYLKKRIVEDVV